MDLGTFSGCEDSGAEQSTTSWTPGRETFETARISTSYPDWLAAIKAAAKTTVQLRVWTCRDFCNQPLVALLLPAALRQGNEEDLPMRQLA